MVIHYVIALINLVVGVIIFSLLVYSIRRLKKVKHMFNISLTFLVVAILFVIHAAFEVLGFRAIYYALTALISTVLLGYVVIVLYLKTSAPLKRGIKR